MDELTDQEKAALEKMMGGPPKDDEGDNNAISGGQSNRQGVLKSLLTVEQKEENYRQTLLTADYIDDEEADRVTGAISEALRYGLSLAPILDWVTNRCSVNKAHGKSRVQVAIEGLTRTQIDTRHFGKERLNNKQKNEMENS